MTSKAIIKKTALKLLSKNINGMRYSELIRETSALHPDIPENTIHGTLWNLDKTEEDKVLKVKRGVFALKSLINMAEVERKKEISGLRIIEIEWDGPFTFEEVARLSKSTDYGLYQFYGTHEIFGPNSLLYLGQASEQKFSERIHQHEEWVVNEYSKIDVYIGRFGGSEKCSDEEWTARINHSEKLLIYFLSPPYNTQSKKDYGNIENTLVMNFGKKNRLPLIVSTLWDESKYWTKGEWALYEYRGK